MTNQQYKNVVDALIMWLVPKCHPQINDDAHRERASAFSECKDTIRDLLRKYPEVTDETL